MDLKGASLFAEMQSYTKQAQGLGDNFRLQRNQFDLPEQTEQVNSSRSDFSVLLKQALENVNGLQKQSSAMATAVEMGDPSVTLAQAMIAGQKASIAFDATVQVRNKLVEAYKEIMAMPL